MALISLSQLRPPRRLIQVRLYRLVNQNPPTFDILAQDNFQVLVHFSRSKLYLPVLSLVSVSFLQRLGYLVFLQVLLLPCLAYSTFHVSRGHNFRFSSASVWYCCSYMYFILVRPFCFGLFVFHLAPGADFVWNEIFLFVGTARLGEPVFFRKKLWLWVYGPGARFSKVPVTFRARNQIFKSKYKE